MRQITLSERLGRLFFQKQRVVLLLILLSAPFLFVESHLIVRYRNLKRIEEAFDSAAFQARAALEKRAQKERFLKRYAHTEPYFINQTLEQLPLCYKELQELKEFSHHPACQQRETVQKRISFLESPENHLAFAEENIRSSARLKETEERLLHPVELDERDLETLLSLIENERISDHLPDPSSPQLQVLDLQLLKKSSHVYTLNLTLLKREWTHEKKR